MEIGLEGTRTTKVDVHVLFDELFGRQPNAILRGEEKGSRSASRPRRTTAAGSVFPATPFVTMPIARRCSPLLPPLPRKVGLLCILLSPAIATSIT